MKKQITNFALHPDENTIKQFENCYKENFVVSASLMPDAHSGYVAPIGAVIKTKNYIVPSWVGYDIGCGMIAVKLTSENLINEIKQKSIKIYNLLNQNLALGLGVKNQNQISSKTLKEYNKILETFKSKEHNKNALNIIISKATENLGSLGSGNHFIELSKSNKDNNLWLVIHTGSRKIGHSLAKMYMKKASNSSKEFEKTFPLKEDSTLGKEYLNILEFCLDFALLNRLEIAYKIHSLLEEYTNKKIEFELWTNKNHNHAIKEGEYYIHRKGATPAKKGEKGVIPANMRDGSFLVEGLGNKNYLESSSHGAGRLYSRKQAKEKISMNEFEETMKGIIGTIKEQTLDESPQAYKNIFEVMKAQDKSVKVLAHLTPIINIKG